jgi:PST family polysaccharide transporter
MAADKADGLLDRPTDPAVSGFDGEAAPTAGETARNVKWSGISVVCREALRMMFALALARLLGPENFGIMSQAAVYVALMSVLLDQGINAALVQKRVLNPDDQGAAFWLSLTATIFLAGLTLATAPLLAAFFRTPELTAVLQVLSISVVLKGLTIVPMGLILRRVRFRRLAWAEIGSSALGGVAGLSAAFLGAEYWSLVVQTMVLDATLFLVIALSAGRPVFRGSMNALRGMWRFSTNAFGFQVLSYATRNSDNILVGRYLGATSLGFYALAYRIMMLPTQTLSRVVNRVAFPTYSRMQDDRIRLGNQHLLATRLVSLCSFPVLTTIIVTAPEAVPLIFGNAWVPAVVPMQVLAVAGMQQSIAMLYVPVVLACGRADWLLRCRLATSVVVIGGIAVGLQWGIVGVAIGFTVAELSVTPLYAWLVIRLTGATARTMAGALLPAAVSAAAAGSLAIAVKNMLDGAQPVTVVAVSSLVIIVAFAALVRLCWPSHLREGSRLLRIMVGRTATE